MLKSAMLRFHYRIIQILLAVSLLTVAPVFAGSVFNALSLIKMEMEQRYGITNLECFPFLENIGTNQDEAQRVQHCLTGTTTLASALKEVPNSGLTIVGISTRYLRSGGFHSLLVPWNASREDMVRSLRDQLAPEKQKQFIADVHQLKQRIQSRLRIRELYCTFRISNAHCLRGYQTLAGVEPNRRMGRMSWASVAITDTHLPDKDRTILTLKYDDPPETMTHRLQNDPVVEIWTREKKIYREIKQQYGKALAALQVPNFFCDKHLEQKECLEGAKNFSAAGNDPGLKRKLWGQVLVHKYNTLIKDDHDVVLRYDLPPGEIVRIFSNKPDQAVIQVNVTLAEKLEKRTKNNSSGLRAVCDLQGLQSADCAQGFKNFITFIRNHRDYRVSRPFTDVMLIDGTRLGRVNFALNSKVRHSYIYVDVHSSPEELAQHLSRFGSPPSDPVR